MRMWGDMINQMRILLPVFFFFLSTSESSSSVAVVVVGVRYIIKGATQVLHNCAIGPAPITAFLFSHCKQKPHSTHSHSQSNARHCTPLYRASRPRNRSCTPAPARSRSSVHEHDNDGLVCQRDPAFQRRGTMVDAQFFRAGCCASAARGTPAERLEDTLAR